MNRRDEYREVYLRSDHWRSMRALALEDAEHCCAVCCGRENLDVHHRTYERIGQERLTDLLVLCRQCHMIFHENGRLAGSSSRSKAKRPKKKKKKSTGYFKPQSQPKKWGRLTAENDRLHRIQQRNKHEQQIAAKARAILDKKAA